MVRPSPRSTLQRLALSFVVTFAGLELLLRLLGNDGLFSTPHVMLGPKMADLVLLRVALAFVGIDLALGVVLIHAVWRRLKSERALPLPERVPPVSVLLPVWNEGAGVRATLEAWVAQRGLDFEVLVGDDGSTDGSVAALASQLGFEARGAHEWAGLINGIAVRLFQLPHAGKGATLNALARHARHDVLVTIDADTVPTEGSLARLAAAFVDDEVDLATGVVTISNGRRNYLTGNQSAEYLKNAFSRIAWSQLDALEQVPGAFAAIRASTFRAAGGFPEDSLTEDYELTWRCVQAGLDRQRPPKVVTVLRAQVFTEGPTTVKGFIAQRTRWFAGFLSTLWRFKHLVGRGAGGSYGLVRFPLKVIDAILPALAFASLIILVRGGVETALGVSRLSIALFLVRWVWDLVVFGLALRMARELGEPARTDVASPSRPMAWALTTIEALTYVWFKHAAALRGFVFAFARVRRWEASRVPESSAAADAR
ncbi:MAG: glycosyltransferase [Myxococcaceae bacterium]